MTHLLHKLTLKLGVAFDHSRFLPDLSALEVLDQGGEDVLSQFSDAAIDLINAGRFADLVARPTETAGEYTIEAVPSAEYLALLSAVTARQHEFSGGRHG